MKRYHTLNIDRFIRDSQRWDDEIKGLKEKLEEIGDLNAISNSEVHSTEISKTTEKKALQRLKITQEIDRLENYKNIYAAALASIDEKDRRLIEGFYFPAVPVNKFVRKTAKDLCCTERTVYTLKRKAVDSLKCEVIALDV